MVGKKIKGRKRHIVTDTQGHLLHITVHEANKHDSPAACEVLEQAVKKHPTIEGFSADQGYRKTAKEYVEIVLKKTMEISAKISDGWAVIAKRWVVERTFSWFNGYRRLSKDYEISVTTAENFAYIAHAMLLLNRFELA
jgi:putative transposase